MRGVWSGSTVRSWEMPHGISNWGVRWGDSHHIWAPWPGWSLLFSGSLASDPGDGSQDPTTMHKKMLGGPNESI